MFSKEKGILKIKIFLGLILISILFVRVDHEELFNSYACNIYKKINKFFILKFS